MAREMILIGCKLPHGLILKHPDTSKPISYRLAGLNESKIIGATYITTEIDAEFWTLWKLTYSDYKPLKAGMIFEAKSAAEAAAKGKELEKVKTGFEGLDPSSMGVKPATKD